MEEGVGAGDEARLDLRLGVDFLVLAVVAIGGDRVGVDARDDRRGPAGVDMAR